MNTHSQRLVRDHHACQINTYVPSLQVQFSRKVKGLPAGKLFDKRTTCQKAQWTTWAASSHAPKCSVQFTQCLGVSSESFSVHFSDIPALVKIDSFPFTQCLSCTHCKNGCVESTCNGAPSALMDFMHKGTYKGSSGHYLSMTVIDSSSIEVAPSDVFCASFKSN